MSDHPIVHRLLDMPWEWRDREVFRTVSGRLTFAELREGMLRMAGWLGREAGVRAGDRVAICLPKGLESAIVIFGILAAGAAFVPLQHRGPPARLGAALLSTRPRLLLTTEEMATRLAGDGSADGLPPVQAIDADGGGGLDPVLSESPTASSIPDRSPDDLAVIFFTSGSTGEPKGVMLGHRTILARITPLAGWDELSGADRLIIHTGLHYVACLDLFMPLASGCSAFLLSDQEAMFADRIVETMRHDGTTIWKSTATTLRLLLEQGGLERNPPAGLRQVMFVGEPLSMATLRGLMAALPRARFLHRFGATEAHRIALYDVPRPLPPDMDALPLGRPAGGYAVRLLDEQDRDVAPGESGELCAFGSPVLLGYWDDPELTAAKRVDGRPDSFRTGDLAFVGKDGLLRWAGRKDHLVKIRGHRLDLGEIEAALKSHPAVREAAAFAVAAGPGESEIRAAALAEPADGLEEALGQHCIQLLPRFAWPARIAVMAKFPLLSSGKVDRQALKALVAAT